ncbi:MAG: adenylate/guanylate cyclase domain-containing protein [Aeromicrobium sp.]|uniref:adenylate/guanylate cyclase domain-containing protein n=1 Tax=Aeromicrobium sp. TaxID=1871063 RepID=UPI003C36191D
MTPPDTRYIDREGADLAYQVFGTGPGEFVYYGSEIMHLDLLWADPHTEANLGAVARNGRIALFQRRGLGLSDRVDYVPTLEQQADDIIAVMDAAGMQRAVFGAPGSACGPVALVAARYPERVAGLCLWLPFPQAIDGSCEDPWASDAEMATMAEVINSVADNWGRGRTMDMWNPTMRSANNRRLMGMLERSSMSPAEARAHWDWSAGLDFTHLLPAIQAPTRVLIQEGGFTPLSWAERIVAQMPDAHLHVLPAPAPGSSIGEGFYPVVMHLVQLALGPQRVADDNRFFGTALFTDVVSSTKLLAEIGDEEYHRVRSVHELAVRAAVADADGQVVSFSGDGSFSLLNMPGAAVLCAERIAREASAAGIEVRCGVHAGEFQREVANATGLNVHVGARVMAAAGAGEVYVSRTVRDLVIGSGLEFERVGHKRLKGIPGVWDLYRFDHVRAPQNIPLTGSLQTPLDKFAVQVARRAPRLMRAMAKIANATDRGVEV